MPFPFPAQNRRKKRRVPGSDFLAWLNAVNGRRGGKKGLSEGFVPAEPDGPKGLTGGAVVDPYSETN
jgi:hypothetical protein